MERKQLSRATRSRADILREKFTSGDPFSLDEAKTILNSNYQRASKTLSYLADNGYVQNVRHRLWVRAGASPNPYRLGARVTSPYAFAYGTALSLYGAAASQRFEILIASPRRFETFEFDEMQYRRVRPWPEGAMMKVSAGPEFIWATTPERTLVDCVRVPKNAGGMPELLRGVSALGSLDSEQLLQWVDHFESTTLAARLGFVLEVADIKNQDARIFYELEKRRPNSRVYLDRSMSGGKLVRRWNLIVPKQLIRSPR